jgi:hypothetical protein
MLSDPELSELLDQAARNLDTLEQLARGADTDDLAAVARFRERLASLKRAYARETDALTRQVLQRAVERRVTQDRRRGVEMQTA